MDAWFVFCRLLVGAALFEFALLIKLLSRVDNVHPQHQVDKCEINNKCRVYDKIAFWAFSSLFILFSLVYFIVCMTH